MRKRVLFSLVVLFSSVLSFAQLTGPKSIPGDYASVAAAITALNTSGVGAGGVTFNIAAGYTETFAALNAGLITATGTLANPIIFQKSGAGANPLITAATPGVGTYDYIFCIGGGDYITFDGINIQENAANTTATTQMEYGFSIKKASATNGAQNNTIKNGSITLSTNTSGYGIHSHNWTYTTPGTTVTVTSVAGTNSYNKYFGLTFNTCYNGIYLYGFADATPYAFYDQGNEVGVSGANTFNGLANGGTTTATYGMYVYYQNGIKLANNTFTGTVPTTTGSCYVFYLMTSNNANVDVYGNTVSLTYNGTGSFYGIYNSGMGSSGTTNAVNYYNNTITNNTLPNFTSGTVYFIYISSGGVTANFYGNNVSNNTVGSATATATGTIYYTYFASSPTTPGTTNMYNNTVTNNTRTQSVAGGGATYIFYNGGSGNVFNQYGNTVNNIITSSTGTTYGLYNLFTGTTKNVYNNTFTNISNVKALIYSLYNGNGSGNAYFYNNKFQNITMASGTGTLYGIYQSSGINVYYYNNYVGELYAPTSANTIYGAYLSGGTSVGMYNNTIYLNATSSGANFSVAGIYASSSPTVELRNNIVVNASTPMGTGRVVAYQRSSTTLTSYAGTSNNNDFWAGTPGASNLIFYDGTNSDQTLAAYQGRVSPRDASSVTENPPFVNVTTSPYDLHLKTTVATQCESGGAVVATPVSIITDYDANPRYPNPGYPNNPTTPASAPDIGADEFGGLLLDLTPPLISFTPFMNTGSTGARLLTTTITDATGVPTSGAGLPRLYWRINTGTWNSVTGTWVSGSTYTFSFGAGAVLNDIVSYYVVAQDIVTPTPNVGANPSAGAAGFTANPPACATPPTTPYDYTIVGTLSGIYPVGVGQVYTTVTAAVADLNLKEVIGPVTFELWDATYSAGETFPLIIYPYAGMTATNTVTFKPKAGVSATVTGSSTTGILVLFGVNYITLNGSNSGGTDKNLTWENTSTAANTYAIGVFNDGMAGASNCTIKNCTVKASSQVTNNTYAIILNALGGGYNNIVIDNNTIMSARYGMQFAGVAGNVAANGRITNNIIGSTVDATAIQYRGIVLSQADNTLISGNEIMGAPAGNTNYSQAGLYIIAGSTNSVIRNNKIHDWYYNGTGGWGQYGVYYASDATTVTDFSNNLIYNIKGDGYSASISTLNVYGLLIYTGGNMKIYHNTIYMAGSVTSSSYANWSACICAYSGNTLLDIRDNILKNSLQPVSGTPASKTYAIMNGNTAAGFTTLNYNDYFVNGYGPNIAYQGGDIATFAAWQTASGQEANGTNTDPMFTSTTNLIPTNGALGHLGTYLTSVPTDINDVSRTNPPDMGAYEFTLDPTVTTLAATAVTSTGATLNATGNPIGSTATTYFDWGLTTAYGSVANGTPASISGSSATAFNAALSGLLPLTTYNYRARIVTAGSVTAYGVNMTFTTPGPPPTVVTNAATSITTTGATLNGTVNANGASTTVTFEYGLTTAYGSTIAGVPGTVTGNTVTAVTGALTGLLSNTLYHFRIKGVSSGGTTNGADLTFTTLAVPPTVVTNPASNITTTGAQLNGTVTANNASTTVTFEWGLTTAYGNIAAATPGTVTGNTATAVNATLSGLLTNTTYHYRAKGVSIGGTVYGLDQSFLTGCPPVGPAGTITGPVSVCTNSAGNVYSVAAITNATGYAWTVPAGAVITAGANTTSITVTFGSTSGNVSVYGTGPCGNGTASNLAVTVNPLPIPTITGPATACQGVAGNVYTTQAGMSAYVWTVSAGGTITAGAGTNAITVTWTTSGAKTVTATYTSASGCAAAAPGTYAVTVNAAPSPTITGPTSMCVNSGYYNYTTETGMTGYVWTVSAGGTITWGAGTNQIQVTWNTAGAQTVTVNYNGSTGCAAPSPTSLAVTVNPMPGSAGTITGTAAVCGGAVGVAYSIAPVANAVSYVWTLPAGATIATGFNTNSITVNFAGNASSGNITAQGNNLCGNGVPSPPFAVTVTQLPAAAGTITGPASVCQNTTGAVYSVGAIANATGYTWTVPAGATIVSGGSTNSITVDFGASATSGNITVLGTNSCGAGTVSPAFAVTVNPKPTTPVVTSLGDVLSSSAATGNQWYFSVDQTGTGAIIPGATGQTHVATQTGWYWTVVTLAGCSSDASNREYVVMVGQQELQAGNFNIYPVPNDGKFIVSMTSPVQETFTIRVFNNLGVIVSEHTNIDVKGTVEKAIDIRPAASGIYTVVIQSNNSRLVKKVLVNK